MKTEGSRLCAIRTKGIEECACMQERVSNDHSRTLTSLEIHKTSFKKNTKECRKFSGFCIFDLDFYWKIALEVN